MKKFAELTTHDGRKVGISTSGALIIAAYKPNPEDEGDMKKAKAVIRYAGAGGQVKACYVRDAFKHMLSLFPLTAGGRAWAHATDKDGQDVSFPHGSIGDYEQLDKGGEIFRVTLDLFNPPVVLDLKTTSEEIAAWTETEDPEVPAPAPDAQPS